MKGPPGKPEPSDPNAAKADAAASETERPKPPPWWVFRALVGVPLVVVALFGAVARSPLLVLVEILLAFAALVVGILVGFLFGIPRTRATSDTDTDTNGSSRDAGGGQPYDKYRPGTSLEQIAEWLTKILIGVGLIQVRAIGNALAALGEGVGKSFDPSVSGIEQFTQLVVVVFATTGFLVSYLWTRIHYGAIQTFADQDVWAKLKAFFTKVDTKLAEQTAEIDITRRVAKATASGRTPAVTEQPSSAGAKPTAAPEKPASAAEQPTGAGGQPTGAGGQPTAATEQPTTATAMEQPTTATDQPATAARESTTATEQPGTATEQPATAAQQLAPTQQPAPAQQPDVPEKPTDKRSIQRTGQEPRPVAPLDKKYGSDLKAWLNAFATEPSNWDTDPVANIFRGFRHEQNDRRLEAEIAKDLGDSLLINLRVRRVAGPPLKGYVTFLLHPTFSRRSIRVKPSGDVAETEIVAWEWFTVGAIADEGATILTLDLRHLPNAPVWFTQP